MPKHVRTSTFCQLSRVFRSKPLTVIHFSQGFAAFAPEKTASLSLGLGMDPGAWDLGPPPVASGGPQGGGLGPGAPPAPGEPLCQRGPAGRRGLGARGLSSGRRKPRCSKKEKTCLLDAPLLVWEGNQYVFYRMIILYFDLFQVKKQMEVKGESSKASDAVARVLFMHAWVACLIFGRTRNMAHGFSFGFPLKQTKRGTNSKKRHAFGRGATGICPKVDRLPVVSIPKLQQVKKQGDLPLVSTRIHKPESSLLLL